MTIITWVANLIGNAVEFLFQKINDTTWPGRAQIAAILTTLLAGLLWGVLYVAYHLLPYHQPVWIWIWIVGTIVFTAALAGLLFVTTLLLELMTDGLHLLRWLLQPLYRKLKTMMAHY